MATPDGDNTTPDGDGDGTALDGDIPDGDIDSDDPATDGDTSDGDEDQIEDPWMLYGNKQTAQIANGYLYWLDNSELHIFNVPAEGEPTWKTSYQLKPASTTKGYGQYLSEGLLIDGNKMIVEMDSEIYFYTLESSGEPLEYARLSTNDIDNIPEPGQVVNASGFNSYGGFSSRNGMLYWLVDFSWYGGADFNWKSLNEKATVVIDIQNPLHPKTRSIMTNYFNDSYDFSHYEYISDSPLLMTNQDYAIQYTHQYDTYDDVNYDFWEIMSFDENGIPADAATLDALGSCCIEPASRISVNDNKVMILWYNQLYEVTRTALSLVDFSKPDSPETLFEATSSEFDYGFYKNWQAEGMELYGNWVWMINNSNEFCAAEFPNDWILPEANCIALDPILADGYVLHVDGDTLYFIYDSETPTIRTESLNDLLPQTKVTCLDPETVCDQGSSICRYNRIYQCIIDYKTPDCIVGFDYFDNDSVSCGRQICMDAAIDPDSNRTGAECIDRDSLTECPDLSGCFDVYFATISGGTEAYNVPGEQEGCTLKLNCTYSQMVSKPIYRTFIVSPNGNTLFLPYDQSYIVYHGNQTSFGSDAPIGYEYYDSVERTSDTCTSSCMSF